MPKLTPEQIADVVHKAGFTKDQTSRGTRDDAVAVAVALCESSGDTEAVGDGGDSLGLFQVHQPTWSGKFMYRGNEWFDAHNNAGAAHAIYVAAGRTFNDWTCYKSGGYLRHLQKALKAVGDPQESPDIRSGDSVAQRAAEQIPGVRDLITLVNFITNERNWIRLGMFVGGGILIIVGLAFAVKETGVAQKAASVVPAGRALRAVKGGKRVKAAAEGAQAVSAARSGGNS